MCLYMHYDINSLITYSACRVRAPVRIMLDRNEDMAATGNRHPFMAKYKVIQVLVVHIVLFFTAVVTVTGWVH